MNAFLHVPVGLCRDRRLSALGCRPQPAVSRERSVYGRRLQALLALKPNTQYLIPFIIFIFVSCDAAMAQEPSPAPAAEAVSGATDLGAEGIQIGERAPDITITNIHNYKSSTAKLSDFEGKILILDFWATWCSPCVAMIPTMDSLQREFGDKVQFLSVTYQSEEEVLPFLKNLERRNDRRYDLPVVVGDSLLKREFPHKYLPHYVWIDRDGIVKGITSFEEVNAANIIAVHSGTELNFNYKDDVFVDYDVKQPLFFPDISEEVISFYFSAFSPYKQGLNSGYYNTEPIVGDTSSTIRITGRNLTIPRLYQIALGKGRPFNWKHTLLHVDEPDKLIQFGISGNAYTKSLEEGRGFCYEVIVPRTFGSQVYEIMENDLRTFFTDYEARIEDIPNQSYVLRKLDDADLHQLKSKGGESLLNVDRIGFQLKNYSLNALIVRLNDMHHSSADAGRTNIFFFNETDFTEPVDLRIDVDIMDIDALNTELQRYGLSLEEEIRPIPMLVITDK